MKNQNYKTDHQVRIKRNKIKDQQKNYVEDAIFMYKKEHFIARIVMYAFENMIIIVLGHRSALEAVILSDFIYLFS